MICKRHANFIQFFRFTYQDHLQDEAYAVPILDEKSKSGPEIGQSPTDCVMVRLETPEMGFHVMTNA